MTSNGINRQARKSRSALLDAFNELVLTRRYADIRIADVIRRADVGRSTFYEHFRNKDDLCRQSMSDILTILASAVAADCNVRNVQEVLEHFRDNLRVARGIMNSPFVPHMVAMLAGLIEARLPARTKSALPRDLAAAQIAEGEIGLIRAWLNQGATCPSAPVAAALHRSAFTASFALVFSDAGA